MKKPVYWGLSKLELCKKAIYDFLYNYVKPKYGEKVNFSNMDKDCFIFHVKTDAFYKNIVEHVETRFETSSYHLNRPFTKTKK